MSLVLSQGLGDEVFPVGWDKDQWMFVVSSVMPADIKQGVDFSLDLQPEAVDEAQLVRIVTVIEGQDSTLIVQEQSHLARGHRQWQDHPG